MKTEISRYIILLRFLALSLPICFTDATVIALPQEEIHTTYTATEICQSEEATTHHRVMHRIATKDTYRTAIKEKIIVHKKKRVVSKRKLCILGIPSLILLYRYTTDIIPILLHNMIVTKLASIPTIHPRATKIVLASTILYIAATKMLIFLATKKMTEQYYSIRIMLAPLYHKQHYITTVGIKPSLMKFIEEQSQTAQ